MKIAANDPRLNVISTNDKEIVVEFTGKVDGDLLVLATNGSKRILHRNADGKFYGRNGNRFIVVTDV